MKFYCPSCGKEIDDNIFFQTTGQCVCSHCGEIVDLTDVSVDTLNDEEGDDQEY